MIPFIIVGAASLLLIGTSILFILCIKDIIDLKK